MFIYNRVYIIKLCLIKSYFYNNFLILHLVEKTVDIRKTLKAL